MKITRVNAIPISIPLIQPIHMAIGTVEKIDYVIVQTYTDKGLVGLGEAAAECGPIFSEESSGTITNTINNYLAPAIVNEDPINLERIITNMNTNVKGNPFAKAAIEISILDIIGKELGIPIYKLIGGMVRDKIPLSWTLAIMDIEEEIMEVRKLVDNGWRIFKIKMGQLPFLEEIDRVKHIYDVITKSKFKDNIFLRLDVNQGWTFPEAKKFIHYLEQFNIDFLEQPICSKNTQGISELRRLTKIPIAIDESLFGLNDALELIIKNAADIFSTKILKAGGIINAKNISAISKAAGIPCYLGAFCETGIGTAAGTHFGVSTANITYGCELIGPLSIREDIIKEKYQIKDGYIYPYETPGLGVTLDKKKLSKYIVTSKK